MMRRRLVVALALSAIPFSASHAEEGACPVQLSEAEFERFLAITTQSEYLDDGRNFILKWTEDVRIAVHGSPTTADLATLQDVVDELNALVDGIAIDIVAKGGNIDLHFVPRANYAEIALSTFEHDRDDWTNIEAYFVYWYNGINEIYRGGVLLNSTGNADVRASSIREEVTQLLGLANDVYGDPLSIFDPDLNLASYSPTDERLIAALYCESLLPGMTADEIRPLLVGGSGKAPGGAPAK